jgi:hypothetical protein
MIKNVVKRLNTLPLIFYAGRGLVICAERLSKTYYPAWRRADKIAVNGDLANYEPLFGVSEENFERIVGPYTSEFGWFFGKIYNSWFESVDAELYYSMVRHFLPDTIIEIGSGHSTRFGMDAVNRNQAGRIVSIDPSPRIQLPEGVTRIQARVQDVDIDMFRELRENDILFVDSSHTSEEALYHCEEILPELEPGVIVHHHDFSFPYRAYLFENPIKYGEPDVLLQFYSDNAQSYEVIVSTSYVRYVNPDLIERLVSSYKWNPQRIPVSLWTRKKKSPS